MLHPQASVRTTVTTTQDTADRAVEVADAVQKQTIGAYASVVLDALREVDVDGEPVLRAKHLIVIPTPAG